MNNQKVDALLSEFNEKYPATFFVFSMKALLDIDTPEKTNKFVSELPNEIKARSAMEIILNENEITSLIDSINVAMAEDEPSEGILSEEDKRIASNILKKLGME